MRNSKRSSKALRSIDPRQLSAVRGGMLWPAVKLVDTVVGVLAGDVYLTYGGISGDATE